MSDELAEFVKISDTTFSGSKPSNVSGDSLSSFIGIHVFELLFVLAIESLFLHQWVVDELIVQEFVKDVQFLDEELVESIDDGAHDSDSVGFDTEQHLVHADRLDLLCLNSGFNKSLGMQVVIVLRYEFGQVPQ